MQVLLTKTIAEPMHNLVPKGHTSPLAKRCKSLNRCQPASAGSYQKSPKAMIKSEGAVIGPGACCNVNDPIDTDCTVLESHNAKTSLLLPLQAHIRKAQRQ